ncbi:unnamed protein product, partial [Heterotrigona itama]
MQRTGSLLSYHLLYGEFFLFVASGIEPTEVLYHCNSRYRYI